MNECVRLPTRDTGSIRNDFQHIAFKVQFAQKRYVIVKVLKGSGCNLPRSTVIKMPLNFANAIPELTYRRATAGRVVVQRILDGVPTFVELRFKAQLIVRITEWSKRHIVVRLVVILRRVLLLSSDGLGTVSSLGGRKLSQQFQQSQ